MRAKNQRKEAMKEPQGKSPNRPPHKKHFLYLWAVQMYTEFSTLLPDLKKEVQDFIEFLKSKVKNENLQKQRKFGTAKGFFEMLDDFDEPLEDFKEYMQ